MSPGTQRDRNAEVPKKVKVSTYKDELHPGKAFNQRHANHKCCANVHHYHNLVIPNFTEPEIQAPKLETKVGRRFSRYHRPPQTCPCLQSRARLPHIACRVPAARVRGPWSVLLGVTCPLPAASGSLPSCVCVCACARAHVCVPHASDPPVGTPHPRCARRIFPQEVSVIALNS